MFVIYVAAQQPISADTPVKNAPRLNLRNGSNGEYQKMRKRKKCGGCNKAALKKAKLLKSALGNEFPFEEAAIYAGFSESNLAKAYRILLTDLPLRKQADIVSKINWGD